MPAYIIARITVTDPDDYKEYAAQTVALAEAAGGKFLVKAGRQKIVEGSAPERHVIVEFPTLEQAEAWYISDAYQAILPFALLSSERDIIIVVGL